jgi:ribosomal protein S18 acetylase RimI-like enzyme
MHTDVINPEQITAADLPELLTLSRQTFYETFAADNSKENVQHYIDTHLTEDILLTECNNPDSIFYLVRQEQKAVGYLKLNYGPAQTELQDNKGLEIERIYVLAACQGLRIGHALLQLAITAAQKQQLDYIWLGVWDQNEKAIGFYKKHGFVSFDRHIFQLGDDAQTDILMRLDLHR